MICTKLSLDHQVYTIGSGLFQPVLPFKRRNVVTFGIDLTYNHVLFTLSISVRYKKVRADADILVKSYYDQRDQFIGDNPNNHISTGTNFQQTIKIGAIFELSGNYYKVLEDYNSSISTIQCKVMCSIIPTVSVGSTTLLDVEIFHNAVEQILNSTQQIMQ